MREVVNESKTKRSGPRKQVEIEKFLVHKLPNYEQDARTDANANTIYCGEVPFTNVQSLIPEIQDRFIEEHGPGWYRLTKVFTNKKLGGITAVPVDYPDEPEPEEIEPEGFQPGRIERERVIVEKPLDAATIRDIATVVAQTVADRMREATPNPEPQPSGQSFGTVLKEALSSIEALDTFKTRLVGENRQGEPQQPAQQMTEFQMLLEVAKLASESQNPDLMEMLRDYVAPQKKTSFIDSLSGIFEAAMPYIPALLQSATNNQTTQQAAPVSVVSSQPVAGPGQQYNSHAQPTAHQMPQQPVQPQMPIDPGQRSLNRVIGRMVEDCLENASVLSVASAIDDLIERYPQFSELASLLVSNSPGEVLAFAKTQFSGVDFSQAPHAEMWIKALQDELAGPTGETGQGEQTWQTTEAQAGATGGN